MLAVCIMFFAVSIQAQAPQGPPKPGPEVKDLDYNVGTWKVEGEAKPFGPMPGGKITSTEKCEWYSGGFFVMCHSEGAGPMGPEKGVSFMGYDPNEKVYTYHEFTSTGEAIDSKGTVERRHLELDRRIKDGRRQDQCARHHQASIQNRVHVQARDVAERWRVFGRRRSDRS